MKMQKTFKYFNHRKVLLFSCLYTMLHLLEVQGANMIKFQELYPFMPILV